MRTVTWASDPPTVRMIDQRRLPGELQLIDLQTVDEVADAIQDMVVRGAPAIGAAAAYGMALMAATSSAKSSQEILVELKSASEILKRSRPTAVNLRWATDRMLEVAQNQSDVDPAQMRASMLKEAEKIADEDIEINHQIGTFGAALLPDDATVIHHCNTGALATVDYGTALGVIRAAYESGKRVHVLVDETRPRLQGARLTAWELQRLGIPYEIITDNAAGHFLHRSSITAVLVGADRVAANGDVANKIGTYMLALAANDNKVPFYCAVPTSTIDLTLPTGEAIPIEERDPEEVLDLQRNGQPIAPQESQARNPAFDITPHRLVTAFITEVGVLRPPFHESLQEAVARGGRR
jgi:methylthioribose-1-phosphate isomerase